MKDLRIAVLAVFAVLPFLLLAPSAAHAQSCPGSLSLNYCGSDSQQVPGGWVESGCGDGHCGTITWYVDELPTGVTANINPPTTTLLQATTITLNIGSSVPTGPYSVEVGATCSLTACGAVSAALLVIPSGTQQPWKDLGCGPASGAPCADPIDIGSGNVFEKVTDYTTAGQNPLSFVRYYNSRDLATTFGGFYSGLQGNWRSNYDGILNILSPGVVSAERPDGKEFEFVLSGSTWVPDADIDYKLTNSGSTWTLTDPDDTVETYTLVASAEALLTGIKYRNGYTQTLTRDPAFETLESVTDSYNRTLSFSQGSPGVLASMTTPDSTTISYTFHLTGSSPYISVTYPTSPASTVTYEYGNSSEPTALTSIVDENGNTYATWTYDAVGRGLTNQLGSGANLTTLTYNDTTGTRTVTNALGVTDTYTFTAVQGTPKKTQISRAATSSTAAATESFSYDTNGFLASATDWNGNQTTYVNNSHGDPTTINEAVGSSVARTTTIAYDSTFVHLPDSVTTTGVTVNYTYDTSGDVLTRKLTDTTSQSVPYSTNGQTRTWTNTWSTFLLASVQNPRTDVTAVTTYGYDSSGALTSITDALSHVTNITSHTGGGRPLTIVDPNGATNGSTTTLTYDARQRLTSKAVSTSTSTLTTTYTLDPAGELTKVTLPGNVPYSYIYDTAHRVTKITNGLNEYIQYTLDALGDVTQALTYSTSGGIWREHTGTFDALGRQLTDVGGVGQTTTYTYDNNGNALTIQDGLGDQTSQAFDALNRLTTVTDANTPAHGVTQTAYDTHDGITSVTDPNGNATSYVHDGFEDVIQQSSPDSGTTVYHYDPDRNLTQKVDALSVTTNYIYDKDDRITNRNYPADGTQDVGYTYDKTSGLFGAGIGRLSTLSDAAGFVNILYDGFGHVGSTRRYNSGGTNLSNVWYGYDSGGRVQGYTYSDGMYVGFLYDAASNIGQVVSVPPGHNSGPTVAWIAHGPMSGPVNYATWGNGVQVSTRLDEDYRITTFQVIATAGNLTNQTLTYDAANNLKTVSDTISVFNNQTLGYDSLNRLTSASSGTGGYGSLAWTYDKVGNPLSSTVGSSTTTYGYTSGSNRLASITNGGTTTVTTNANGNITSIPPANNGSTAATFAYNLMNRLSSVTGSPTAATFVTDGFGQRYSKTDSGSNPITYLYDIFGNMIEENNNGAVTDYIYEDGRPIGIFVPNGGTGTLYYVHPDRQGIPQMVTNSLQLPVWITTYQPYGTTGTIVSSIVQNLRFPGQYADTAETGFNYNLNRDYMPNLGRYLETDLIGLTGGLNTYAYAKNNPGKFTDSTGRLTPPEVIESLALVAALYQIAVYNRSLTQSPPANAQSASNVAQVYGQCTPAKPLGQSGDTYYSNAPSDQEQWWDSPDQPDFEQPESFKYTPPARYPASPFMQPNWR